jgi:hypothetical protein
MSRRNLKKTQEHRQAAGKESEALKRSAALDGPWPECYLTAYQFQIPSPQRTGLTPTLVKPENLQAPDSSYLPFADN